MILRVTTTPKKNEVTSVGLFFRALRALTLHGLVCMFSRFGITAMIPPITHPIKRDAFSWLALPCSQIAQVSAYVFSI